MLNNIDTDLMVVAVFKKAITLSVPAVKQSLQLTIPAGGELANAMGWKSYRLGSGAEREQRHIVALNVRPVHSDKDDQIIEITPVQQQGGLHVYKLLENWNRDTNGRKTTVKSWYIRARSFGKINRIGPTLVDARLMSNGVLEAIVPSGTYFSYTASNNMKPVPKRESLLMRTLSHERSRHSHEQQTDDDQQQQQHTLPDNDKVAFANRMLYMLLAPNQNRAKAYAYFRRSGEFRVKPNKIAEDMLEWLAEIYEKRLVDK